MKREQISIGDKIKIKKRKFEVVKIGKNARIDKKGNVEEYEEFELRNVSQKSVLPKAIIEWFEKSNKIIFRDILELKEEDIKRVK